jgi:hypothetical protein
MRSERYQLHPEPVLSVVGRSKTSESEYMGSSYFNPETDSLALCGSVKKKKWLCQECAASEE